MTSIMHGAVQSGASVAGTMDSIASLCGEGAINSPHALLAAVQHRFEDQLSKEHVPRFWAALLDSSQGSADDHSVEGLCTALRVRTMCSQGSLLRASTLIGGTMLSL